MLVWAWLTGIVPARRFSSPLLRTSAINGTEQGFVERGMESCSVYGNVKESRVEANFRLHTKSR